VRAEEEWVVCEQAHTALVSEEVVAASQKRFEGRPTRQATGVGRGRYLFAGMVHCVTGHQPLSMTGKAQKGRDYYACSYGSSYGDAAALETHAGQKWIYLNEAALSPVVERFFEGRILGPMRLDRLAKQLKSADRDRRSGQRHAGTALRKLIADSESRIKLQLQALEAGVDPDAVSSRIKELRADIAGAEADLTELGPEEVEAETDDLAARLARVPDLAAQLRAAPREIQRQTYEAFGLRIEFDKVAKTLVVSGMVTEAVAEAFESTKALREGGLPVIVCDIAGARCVARGDGLRIRSSCPFAA
jgi:hypothetical protein